MEARVLLVSVSYVSFLSSTRCMAVIPAGVIESVKMRRRSVLALSLWMSSLMLLSLRGMKASPLRCEADDIITTTDSTVNEDTTTSSMNSGEHCGWNSQFDHHGPLCPKSCDNLYYIYNTICFEITVPGCVCDEGYVLESDFSKNCVRAETCTISCAEHMHYQTGASHCQASCFMPSISESCDNTWSYDGCVCDDGYIFSLQYPYNASNVCIRPSECWYK